jgi:hypothetical protein
MICHESAHVLPQKIDKTLFDKVHVCDNTNDITQNHNGIFINALSDTMPQCDIVRHKKRRHVSCLLCSIVMLRRNRSHEFQQRCI